jgi:hypothetical protein
MNIQKPLKILAVALIASSIAMTSFAARVVIVAPLAVPVAAPIVAAPVAVSGVAVNNVQAFCQDRAYRICRAVGRGQRCIYNKYNNCLRNHYYR